MERPLIDTHCHMNFSPLKEKAEAALHRAFLVGVDRVLVPAYDHASWQDIEKMCVHGSLEPAFGIHPWVEEPVDVERLRDTLLKNNAVAIGEIGLDTKVESPDSSLQQENFRRQLALAVELDLPVMLHCRGAFEEMLSILDEFKPSVRGVMHAFSRGPELMERFLNSGLYIAFGGAVTRPNAKHARQSAAMVPADRMLLETDAPSIGLHDVAPENVEPRHIIEIAVSIAEVRAESFDKIADWTTKNARDLFRI